jgi:hypothetical protein
MSKEYLLVFTTMLRIITLYTKLRGGSLKTRLLNLLRTETHKERFFCNLLYYSLGTIYVEVQIFSCL